MSQSSTSSNEGEAVEHLLDVRGLTVGYGGILALRDLDLRAEKGEIVALLGANGAGKSSTLAAISGLVSPREGSVWFDGHDVTKASPELRVRLGLSLTPEGRRVFPSLTVAENLRLGAAIRREAHDLNLERMFEWFPVLESRYQQPAGQLSGGEQQQLAIARSLMSEPILLLLDEPSLGLAPRVVDLIFDIVLALKEQGVTILLVEQNVDRSLGIADRAYVLASGSLCVEGTADDLLRSGGIEAAYLGVGVV